MNWNIPRALFEEMYVSNQFKLLLDIRQVEYRSMSKKSGTYQPRARLAAPDENSAPVAPRSSKLSRTCVIGSVEAPWGPVDWQAREVCVCLLCDCWGTCVRVHILNPLSWGPVDRQAHEVCVFVCCVLVGARVYACTFSTLCGPPSLEAQLHVRLWLGKCGIHLN